MPVALLGRVVIGAAAAPAWLSIVKFIGSEFDSDRNAQLSGLAIAIAMGGAAVAHAPLAAAASSGVGWRVPMLAAGGLSLVLAALLHRAFNRHTERSSGHSGAVGGNGGGGGGGGGGGVSSTPLREVLRLQTALLTVHAGALCTVQLAFAGLWLTPFLQVAYGWSPTAAAGGSSLFLAGFAVGCPVLGRLSDTIGSRQRPALVCAAAGAVACAAIVFVERLPAGAMLGLILALGFSLGHLPLIFTMAKEGAHHSHTGAVCGAVNTAAIMLPGCAQVAVGALLDWHWEGAAGGAGGAGGAGARVYSARAYRVPRRARPVPRLLGGHGPVRVAHQGLSPAEGRRRCRRGCGCGGCGGCGCGCGCCRRWRRGGKRGRDGGRGRGT